MPILADYFIVVSVPIKEENIEVDGVEPTILFRYPEKDHKKHRFPENAPFFCFPEGAKIEYKDRESRKPSFFTFCFTVEDGSRSYGTTLFYFEPLKIGGEKKMNKDGKQLYVPKALCLLSHQPMFSAFAIFLRELFRNTISSSEDEIDNVSTNTIRSSSFDSNLRKGSTCNVIDDVFASHCPVERQIRYFIDAPPSLDPSLQINIVAFQKLIEITMPPKHCLPFTDKLCFDSLLNSLSSGNISKVVSCLLQEKRILLVSSQMDTLTLCAEAFISLLYPFKWMHPLVPILPTQLIEYLEAPTPYLMGVQTSVYQSEQCQMELEGVVIVQLDFDKVSIPKDAKTEPLPKPFLKKLEKLFAARIPPPSTRLLYCDAADPLSASYLVFEVMFGPGKLGIKMKSRATVLTEGEAPIDAVYLENVPDEDITIVGPGKRVPLLRKEPTILAVNGDSVTGKSLKQVVKVLSDAYRPLTLRLQIGVAPAVTLRSPSMHLLTASSGSLLATVSEVPESPMSPMSRDYPMGSELQGSAEGRSEERTSPMEISIDSVDTPSSASALSPQTSEDRVIRRYYRDRSKRGLLSSDSSSEDDAVAKRAEFVEQLRVCFLLEICELLDGYEEFLQTDEGIDADHVFNTKAFLKNVDEDVKPLMKQICKTQLFSHFIHDAYEYDDNYETQVFNDVMKLKKELGEYTEAYVFESLLPDNWKTTTINVDPCNLRGLPEGWEGTVFMRDPEIFPEMNPELFGEPIKRVKLENVPEDNFSFVPEDLKSLRKELKSKAKSKKEKGSK